MRRAVACWASLIVVAVVCGDTVASAEFGRLKIELYTEQLICSPRHRAVEVYAQIVETKEVGSGTRYLSINEVPAGLAPELVARFSRKQKEDSLNTAPLTKQISLLERCCGNRFHATLPIPDDAADGSVEIELSFDAWTEGLVEPHVQRIKLETRDATRAIMPWQTWRAAGDEANSGALRLPIEAGTSLAFTPDGAQLAAAGRDGVTLFDVASGKQVTHYPCGAAEGIDISRDGRYLVVVRHSSPVLVYDLATRKEIASATGHEDLLAAVRFSPNGEWFVSAGQGIDKPDGGAFGEVRLWRTSDGQPLPRLQALKQMVYALAVAPSGRSIATGGGDGSVKLWSVGVTPAEGEIEATITIEALPEEVRAVVFAPSGEVIAVGIDSFLLGSLRIFDVASGQPLMTVDGLPGGVRALAFAELPDRKGGTKSTVLAAGMGDQSWRSMLLMLASRGEMTLEEVSAKGSPGHVRLWGLHFAEGRCLLREAATFKVPDPVQAVALSPDGQSMAAAVWAPEKAWDDSVYLWRTPAVESVIRAQPQTEASE
jgi:WD40 repeat protein